MSEVNAKEISKQANDLVNNYYNKITKFLKCFFFIYINSFLIN